MSTATLEKAIDRQPTCHFRLVSAARTVETVGRHSIRYGLVLVLFVDRCDEVHGLRGRRDHPTSSK